ncbi:molybdenum cofactor biosynthesis protein MoaE [Salinimonas marina]|uniref:Molybdopterin synthase catalytic subunit n=1 Tax=Salinimonas marina TaxID=2785918 RepID=A0A7S9HED4_9ALTE|nr:molybdenum cofactor biosynthesis protein MoaE [Salinimonas marina]QPG06772.1 molybdenum cofactor biosynthesis protein MoaE [Salinimonas marina]
MFAHICTQDFNQQALYDALLAQSHPMPGAIVTFTGLVRDFNASGAIDGMSLEHYPGMTEKAMLSLLEQASQRFGLAGAGAVHRVGKLANFEQIVWVGCSAAHRQDAFDAASFVMDTLKQAVPIWKQEYQQGQARWVAPKASDEQAAMAWLGSFTDK